MIERQLLLQAKKLAKVFPMAEEPFELFSEVDLEIYSKDTISCIGRSGEGKTTLMHILAGLAPPSSGDIFLSTGPLTKNTPDSVRAHYFGFIFQSFHLLEELDSLANILLPAQIARKSTYPNSLYWDRARYLLAKVHLEHKAHIKAKWLSGGEKQRIAIARSLIMDPYIIFADEPTGSLDCESAATTIDLLLSVVQEEKKALFLVSHQSDLASLCSKRTILQQKRLIHVR
jgi:lipoprotein-releasing system ATP-binding protein